MRCKSVKLSSVERVLRDEMIWQSYPGLWLKSPLINDCSYTIITQLHNDYQWDVTIFEYISTLYTPRTSMSDRFVRVYKLTKVEWMNDLQQPHTRESAAELDFPSVVGHVCTAARITNCHPPDSTATRWQGRGLIPTRAISHFLRGGDSRARVLGELGLRCVWDDVRGI